MSKPYLKTSNTNSLRRLVSAFTMWRYVKAITKEFIDTDAFKLGIIDKDGKYLKDPNNLSNKENKALTPFDVMIFDLKKLFSKIPNPSIRVKLKYIPTAIPLLAEEAAKYGADEAEICEGLLLYLHEKGFDIDILEEDPNEDIF